MAETFPRLLVIDFTRVGAENATGQLKRNFLNGWGADAFLQIAVQGDRYLVVRSLDDPSTDTALSAEGAVLDEVASFEPEVIYYRPTIDLHPHLHALALEVLARHPVPLVTHIMDDWPRRLEADDEERGRKVDRALRDLLSRSDKVLSISEKMSAAFGDRYGTTFEPIANGVDPDKYRAVREAARLAKRGRKEVVLRYCGALAGDMTFQTVVDVARAVDSVQGELPVRFEVYTMPPWRRRFERAVAGLRGVTISDAVFGDDFPSLLAEADILVLAYNFDQDSLRYVGLSMPNKLPEYLASGAPVLAVGPRAANGIDYVLSHDLGCCVTERDPGKLAEALRRLGTDVDYRSELTQKAQAWALDQLDLGRISARFQMILREAARGPAKRVPLLGPYSRAQRASVDEAEVAARLLAPLSSDGVLLDIGAHHGSCVRPFAEAGWTVVACEPDSRNRAMLTKRFGSMSNVRVDPRAVSDEPAEAAPLFSSTQSSGISSLHAFDETHSEAERVAVTTVSELVDSHALSRIDFLKIDVEGLDWNVLKGVPWDQVKPEVIECEFEDAKTVALGHSYRDIADYLVARGYTVYLSEWHPIVRYGVPHDWRQVMRYPTPLGSRDAWGNILAFRSDPGRPAVSSAFGRCLSIDDPAAIEADGATRAGARPGNAGEVGYDAGTVAPTGLSRYERFYEWAKTRNPAVLFMGRLGAWCGRKVRRYPALAAAYVALLVGLVVVGFLPGLTTYAALFWVAAGALATAGVVGVVLGFAHFLIKEAQHELDRQQVNLRRRLEGLETSLGAKVDELLSAEKSTRDALLAEIDQLNRDQKAGNDAQRKLIDDRLEAGQKQMLRHVSLRFARLQAHSADFDGVVLLMTPERSGSTWFLDLLRCHPAALFLPAVDIFRELGVRGRRYPLHLSDGFGETLDIEAEEGVGAGIPAFTLRDVGTRPGSRLAVEKIHPSAIRFDVPGFVSRIDEMEDATHKQIRCCYLTRDPVDSIRSFVAYKRREPGWGIDAPISSAPDLYLRSFEALVELISKRPGPVVRYERLAADPIQTVASVYQWLWPEIGRSRNASIASEAVELTRRDRVENAQTGRFLGQADDATPTTTSLLLGSDDELPEGSHRVIQECRRLSAAMAELGSELPSASDE
jgi:FkbM family methyltransferase